MKAIILAAGYGTRLYPLTRSMPKALLPVNGRPVLEYILEKLAKIELDEIILVVNNKFYPKFIAWLDNYIPPHPLLILNDGSNKESDRLGAIGDLLFAIEEGEIKDDLLVFACDTIFTFTLHQFLFAIERAKDENWIMLCQLKDKKLATSYGVAKINEVGQVIKYVEKPKEPFSNLVSVGIYYLPQVKFDLLKKFSKKENKDAPGYYIQWLVENDRVLGMVQRRGEWIDIGNLHQYKKAGKLLKRRKR